MNNFWLNLFNFISFLGGQKIMLILITLTALILFFTKKDKLLTALILSNYILTLFIVVVLKYLIEKPRNPLALIQEDSFAFPSGHVAIATTTFLLIFYLANFLKKKVLINTFKIISVIWLTLIIIDRLYLKVHDIYDIFGGIIAAIIIFYILIHLKIFQKYKLKDELSKIKFK